METCICLYKTNTLVNVYIILKLTFLNIDATFTSGK